MSEYRPTSDDNSVMPNEESEFTLEQISFHFRLILDTVHAAVEEFQYFDEWGDESSFRRGLKILKELEEEPELSTFLAFLNEQMIAHPEFIVEADEDQLVYGIEV